jgi:hypothetical protein
VIATLSAELEAALLRALDGHWDYENRAKFKSRLARPVFVLSDAAGRLGQWIPQSRTIELSRPLVLERPWLEVTSVLEHEMAHQYVHEVLGVRDESAHGETFRRVCAERGIDPKAAGAPSPAQAPTPEAIHALDRIRKLLALAGSPNQHEAELAMQKAHELMLRHNIAEASLRAARGFEVRHVGDPEKRTTRVESAIGCLLVDFFFVKVIRVPVFVARTGKSGSVYELIGTHANVEMAAHVHAFLLATAERLWHENRRDARVQSGRDRLAYQAGVIDGFAAKLRAERSILERGLAQSQGLVWVRDGQLDTFYRRRHPHISTRRSTVKLGGAHQAGREAGKSIVLHRPVGSSAGSRGRLLGGG